MKGLNYNKIHKYIVTAVCDGPLHIGNAVGGAEEILIHPVNGFPFIQASGIAGVFRRCCDDTNPQLTEKLFGPVDMNSSESQSRVRISDGTFINDVIMELRPHVRIDRKTGSTVIVNGSGQKFNMEYIGAGAKFTFIVYLYTGDDEDMLKKAMEGILAMLRSEGLYFGTKKSSGAGKVFLSELLYKVFDLTTSEGRKNWIDEEELKTDTYEIVSLDSLSGSVDKGWSYVITVKGATEGSILVKGIAVNEFGKDVPNSENIRNANNDYIIPGSSFRGSIRSQMEKIAAYLKKSNLIPLAFGTESVSGENGHTGNLIFYDTIIGDQESNDKLPSTHRIHIDKFTGGVFQKGHFMEKNAGGNMVLKVEIQNRNQPDATLALLILALRDLAIHTINLGSGYSVGKGMIKVGTIEIVRTSDQYKAAISFGGVPMIEDPKGVLATAFDSLKNMEA